MIAVLWGSATSELNWIHISPKHGRVSIARAHAGGFWVREYFAVEGISDIAEQAIGAWHRLRLGEDLADRATHRLRPPHMHEIELIENAA